MLSPLGGNCLSTIESCPAAPAAPACVPARRRSEAVPACPTQLAWAAPARCPAGRIEVSRAFGDRQFKRSGMSVLPDIQAFQLGPREAFLLLACDGFWGALRRCAGG